jgi:hypothetical protein
MAQVAISKTGPEASVHHTKSRVVISHHVSPCTLPGPLLQHLAEGRGIEWHIAHSQPYACGAHDGEAI